MIVPFARGAVVAAACSQPRLVEAVNRLAIRRLEGEMEAGGRGPVSAHEQLVGGEEARPFHADFGAHRREHGGVERLAGVEVGHAQMDVVEQPAPVEEHVRHGVTRPP